MRTEKRVIGDIMPAALFAVLFGVILILVVFCAKGYGGITGVREANGETRTLLTYVNTTVKANETADVRIEDRGGKEVLCIEDPSTGYEQLLFLEDGKIFELYGPAGQDPDASRGFAIGASSLFELEMTEENLLSIRTDAGTAYVRISLRRPNG